MKTETYYRQFIQQNTDGIFRIDFDAALDPQIGASQFAEIILEREFIGEYNHAFAALNDLDEKRNAQKLRLRDVPELSRLLNADTFENFYRAGFLAANLEFERQTTGIETIFFVVSLRGIMENGRLVCIWGSQRDASAEKSALKIHEEEIKTARLAQKIDALGRLAGGIAHDFNNFLAVIVLQNDLLNLQLPANSPLRHRTGEMKKATDKATAMVRQLLALGRKQTLNPKPTDISGLIKEFSKALPSIVDERIKVEIAAEDGAGICFIDQNLLLQSLANLAQNAAEAMPGGGTLRIETSHIVLDKNSIRHKSQQEGSFVQIVFSDTGAGMDAATLESAFEPFFSTKKSAKGVGLGLATVYGFVKQSKGFIWVESEPDRGTIFKIQFPRIDQPNAPSI